MKVKSILMSLAYGLPCSGFTMASRRLGTVIRRVATPTVASFAGSHLHLGNHTETNVFVPDESLLIADIFAIVLACQLLGLQDVLDNPTFWTNGGWLQPISFPHSLPTLVSRICINSVEWVAAGLLCRNWGATKSSSDTVLSGLRVAGWFLCVRLSLDIAASAVHLYDWNLIEGIRSVYFIAVIVIGVRFLLNRLSR